MVSLLMVLALLIVPEGGNVTIQEWCNEITIFAILILFIQVSTYRWFSQESDYLIPMFIVVSYFFHFSQIALYNFSPEMSEQFTKYSVMRSGYVKEAAVVAAQSIICVYWGIITYLVFFKKEETKEVLSILYNPSPTFIFVLLAIGFVSDFVYNIYVMFTIGYGNVETNTLLNTIRLFSLLFPSGIVLLFTRDNISLNTKHVIFIAFILYKVVCMLTGYRAFALITMVLMFYLYTKTCYHFKLTFKTSILGLVAVFFGSALLASIRDTRNAGFDINEIYSLIADTEKNPLLNILAEFGITLNVMTELYSELHGVGTGGEQLLASIMSVVPGIRVLMPNVDFDSMTLDTALSMHHLGGSYTSDMLYDFGSAGFIPASFLLGMIYGKVYTSFEMFIKYKYYNHVAVMFPVMVDLFFTIRTSLARMPRTALWYFALFFFLWVLFSRKGVHFKY